MRVGVFFAHGDGNGYFSPADQKSYERFTVSKEDRNGARDGEFVEAQTGANLRRRGQRYRQKYAKIIRRIGDQDDPGALTTLTIAEFGLNENFPALVMNEVAVVEPLSRSAQAQREDLCHLPFLAIDPVDARDHDDAICALEDGDDWILWVAIADVSHYVPLGSKLDKEARRRGFSVYFPDRAVPMLPAKLSGDLCSLRAGEIKPVLALEMRFDAKGRRKQTRITRAVAKMRANISYCEAQRIEDEKRSAQEIEKSVRNLFALYRILRQARSQRPPLDLDLPEREARFSQNGKLEMIEIRDRLDSHRLVEEMMIIANEAAVEILLKAGYRQIFRIHEEPEIERIEDLRAALQPLGMGFGKRRRVKQQDLNSILARSRGGEYHHLVSQMLLRSQQQARYDCRNTGHFGLNLRHYAHFTSPIRRYPDLITHHLLVSLLEKDRADIADLEQIAQETSNLERRTVEAERAALDRYTAAYLREFVGAEFTGHISGIKRYGLFVTIDECGADGFVPRRNIGKGGIKGFSLGQKLKIRLVESNPISGGLLLTITGRP